MKRMRNIDVLQICSGAIKVFYFYWINLIHRKVYKTFIENEFDFQLVSPTVNMSFLT